METLVWWSIEMVFKDRKISKFVTPTGIRRHCCEWWEGGRNIKSFPESFSEYIEFINSLEIALSRWPSSVIYLSPTGEWIKCCSTYSGSWWKNLVIVSVDWPVIIVILFQTIMARDQLRFKVTVQVQARIQSFIVILFNRSYCHVFLYSP